MTIARSLFLALCMLCVCGTMYTQEQKGEASQPAPAATPQLPPDQSSPPKIQSPQQIRVEEGVTRGLVIRKVPPEYPVAVRAERVQGSVILRTVFGTAGDFKEVQVIGGDNRLVLPSLKAVRQWKCKPYEVDGHPAEVETDITLNFKLH